MPRDENNGNKDDLFSRFIKVVDNNTPENADKGVPKGVIPSNEGSSFIQKSKKEKVKPALESNEKSRLINIANILFTQFFEVQKKYKEDTKLTKISQLATTTAKKQSPIDKFKEKIDTKKPLSLFKIATGLLVVGITAAIYGMMNDNALRGSMKMLSKVGLKASMLLFQRLTKGFMSMIGGAGKMAMGLLKGTKLGGMLLKMGKFFTPLLKILKKIPLIGSILSVGFAIARFKSGDVTGGVIEILAGLSGLLNLIPGGTVVAIPLVLGFDALNAWLDMKTAGKTGSEKSKAKLDILKQIGTWIGRKYMKAAPYMPIIGTFIRWGKAWQALKSGNVLYSLRELINGLITFAPGGGALVYGFETLLSLFNEKEEKGKGKPSKVSWIQKVKDWIKKKLNDLPWALRKPLEFFGIISDEDSKEGAPKEEQKKSEPAVAKEAEKKATSTPSPTPSPSPSPSVAQVAVATSITPPVAPQTPIMPEWLKPAVKDQTEPQTPIMPTFALKDQTEPPAWKMPGFDEELRDRRIAALAEIASINTEYKNEEMRRAFIKGSEEDSVVTAAFGTVKQREMWAEKYKRQEEARKKQEAARRQGGQAKPSDSSLSALHNLNKLQFMNVKLLQNIYNAIVYGNKQLVGAISKQPVSTTPQTNTQVANIPMNTMDSPTLPINANDRISYAESPYSMA